jgi:hypothetical protein
METHVWTGYHIVRMAVLIFLYSKLGKNLKLVDLWWASGRAAETSKRMQAGTEASRYSRGSGRKEHVVQMDDAGLSGIHTVWNVVGTDGTGTYRRPDGMARSFGWLTGNLNSSELQVESSDITLNSGIPVYSIFYIQVFLSKHKMRPIKLTLPIKGRSINRPDNVVSRPDSRLHKARIAIQIHPSGHQTAFVRTRIHQIRKLPIRLQPSGRLPIVVRTRAHQIWKIACWRSAVRTFTPHG